jgi:hypothetical protein
MHREAVLRSGARHPLVVGDRLDTDIEGAVNAGIDSLLVLTGVTGLAELVAARPGERPTFLSVDLGGLAVAHPEVAFDGGVASVRGWTARIHGTRVVVSGDGERDDWWRAVAAGAWDHYDRCGQHVDIEGLRPPRSPRSMSEGATEHTTGLASVDTVVESVAALEDRPVEEHVAVFEGAHERLRRALDDAPGE